VSDQVALRQPGEKEGIWLARALDVLNQTLPLTRYVNPDVANPGKTFIMEQYKAHRCALFHAKSGEHPLLRVFCSNYCISGLGMSMATGLAFDGIQCERNDDE